MECGLHLVAIFGITPKQNDIADIFASFLVSKIQIMVVGLTHLHE